MSKKTSGNEEQKRKAAREAKAAGKRPSEVAATTGASKQREHHGGNDSHAEKIAARDRGREGTHQDQRNQTEVPRAQDGRSRAEDVPS
jgi:hypothetical protein